MGVKVKSTKTCFFNGQRYRPGEVFELPDGVKPGEFMEVVKDAPAKDVKAKAVKPKPEGPQTFSEITAQDSKAQAVKGVDDLV
jgi:hypothetical protein